MTSHKAMKTNRRRLTFSPNINSTVMSSPDCSPIKGEACVLNMSTSPCDFSSRSPNKTIQSKCEVSSFFNLSYLNKTISIENILKSKNMEKYIAIFHNHEIYKLAVFKSLTKQKERPIAYFRGCCRI